MPDDSNRLSAEETASRLGISVDDLKNLRRRGRIRGYPNYGNWVFEGDDVARLAEELGAEETPSEKPSEPTPVVTDPVPPEEPPEEPPHESSRPTSAYIPASLESVIDNDSNDEESQVIPAARSASIPPAATNSTPEVLPPATSAVSLLDLIEAEHPIPSARIIEALAAAHGVGFDQAAGVVDGFWDHLLDSDRYNQGNRKFSLPYFGTFSLHRGREQRTQLRFVSRPIDDLQFRRNRSGSQRPSTSWIDHWEQHEGSTPARLASLSLKRRLAVLIADETGLDLRTTFGLLWDLFETVSGIMAAGKTSIRWACRGEMAIDSTRTFACYTFRTYKRLGDRLPELAAPQRSSRQHNFRTGAGPEDETERLRLEVETKKLSVKVMIGCGLLGLVFFILPIVIVVIGAFFAANSEMEMHMKSEARKSSQQAQEAYDAASLKSEEGSDPPQDQRGR